MIADLKIALTCIYIGVVVAVPFAIMLPKLQPQVYRRLISARSFAFGAVASIVCMAMSIAHFAQGRPHVGGFFASIGTLGLFVLSILALRRLMGLESQTTRKHKSA